MNEKTYAAVKSYGRHFVGACLAAFAVAGGDVFSLDAEGFKTIITAGVVAVLPVLLRALDVNETAFGKKK